MCLDFIDIPLEEYLNGIESDKVFVHSSYPALGDHVIFIRNSEEGRQFMYDWVAIGQSGLVQCHSFEKVAPYERPFDMWR